MRRTDRRPDPRLRSSKNIGQLAPRDHFSTARRSQLFDASVHRLLLYSLGAVFSGPRNPRLRSRENLSDFGRDHDEIRSFRKSRRIFAANPTGEVDIGDVRLRLRSPRSGGWFSFSHTDVVGARSRATRTNSQSRFARTPSTARPRRRRARTRPSTTRRCAALRRGP